MTKTDFSTWIEPSRLGWNNISTNVLKIKHARNVQFVNNSLTFSVHNRHQNRMHTLKKTIQNPRYMHIATLQDSTTMTVHRKNEGRKKTYWLYTGVFRSISEFNKTRFVERKKQKQKKNSTNHRDFKWNQTKVKVHFVYDILQ